MPESTKEFSEQSQRWFWTAVHPADSKLVTGWAETEAQADEMIREVVEYQDEPVVRRGPRSRMGCITD